VVSTRSTVRALRASLVLVSALCGCSTSPIGTDAVAPAHDVEILQNAPQLGPNAFSPTDEVISLASRNSVTWYNGDLGFYGGGAGTDHHLVSDDGVTFDSNVISPNGVFRTTFAAPGTYAYHCEIHPGMTGTVTVNP
jgi:plastocyanin